MKAPTFEELIKPIKVNMWILGIPLNLSKINLRFYIFVLFMTMMIIEETAFLVSKYSPENFLELTQLAPCTLSGLMSLLKILPLAAKRKKIFELNVCLDGLYNSILTDPGKKAVVDKDIVVIKMLIKYFFILNAALITVYNFSTLLLMLYIYITTHIVEFLLPFAVIVPFSVDSWPTWFIVYFHSVICGFTAVLFLTTIDSLYYVMTSQICNNFSIISNQLENLDERNTESLKELVKYHQNVLELSEDLEDIFTLPNFFNVLICTFEICALGFDLTMGEFAQIPGFILFLAEVLIQILLISVFGEKLIEESRKVSDAAFNCKWYDMDNSSKKTVLIIMTRAQRPQQLTANKFSVMSYANFTKIISTSWSYFTILNTVYTPETQQIE